jgi:hypothetical protein
MSGVRRSAQSFAVRSLALTIPLSGGFVNPGGPSCYKAVLIPRDTLRAARFRLQSIAPFVNYGGFGRLN